MNSVYQLVDRRNEIAKFEREYRPFPPLAGSVSKPKPSTQPENDWCHAKWAEPGLGIPISYVLWNGATERGED